MNKFLLRFLLVAAVTILAVSLTQSGEAQPFSQNASAKAAQSAPVQSPPTAQQQGNNEAQMPASGDTTTHEANAFTGRVVRQDGEIVLMDAVSKVTYKFDDPAKAKKIYRATRKSNRKAGDEQQHHSGGEHRNNFIAMRCWAELRLRLITSAGPKAGVT